MLKYSLAPGQMIFGVLMLFICLGLLAVNVLPKEYIQAISGIINPELPKTIEQWLAMDFLGAEYVDTWADAVYYFQDGTHIALDDWKPVENQAQFDLIKSKADTLGFLSASRSPNEVKGRLTYFKALRKWFRHKA